MTETTFAFTGRDGELHDCPPDGQHFTTERFTITTEEEAANAFAPIGTVIDLDVTHPGNALAIYSAEDRARFLIVKLSPLGVPVA